MARAGQDDVAAQGQVEGVLAAGRDFEKEIQELGLRINLGKSRLYLQQGDLPAYAPPDLALAGELVEGRFERGLTLYGVPVVGTDA